MRQGVQVDYSRVTALLPGQAPRRRRARYIIAIVGYVYSDGMNPSQTHGEDRESAFFGERAKVSCSRRRRAERAPAKRERLRA